MIRRLQIALGGWFATLPWSAWAAQSNPGIDPTLFVFGVGAAVLGGAAAGYYLGSQDDGNS